MLAECMKELTPQERTIIIFRYYKGISLQEISRKLSLSYGITKLRHRSAVDKLSRLMRMKLSI